MTLRTPLIYNPTTQRIDELPVGDQLASSIIAGLAGRNAVINGNFDFWQRGIIYTPPVGGQGYCADRWVVANSGGATHQVNQGSNALGAGAAESSKLWQRSVVMGATASSAAWTGQYIENVRTFAGETVTFSFWVYGPNGAKVGARLLQVFGSGGSPSAAVNIEISTVTVSAATWTKYEGTVTLPSLAGKTLGTDGNDALYLVIDFCGTGYGGVMAGQNGTFGVAQVQLEKGNSATPFDIRPLAYELMLCQRYYEKSYNLGVFPGAISQASRMNQFFNQTAGGASYGEVRYAVRKRIPPIVLIYASETGTAARTSGSSGADSTSTTVNSSGDAGFGLTTVNASGNFGLSFHYVADAEI